MDTTQPTPDRYHWQSLLPGFGVEGQKRLAGSRVVLVGCGALGGTIAEQLARAGVGFLRLVDRDLVEWTNLQRQTLFDERHARENTPKAIAAAERLGQVNSTITIESHIADLHPGNIDDLAGNCHLILDATDNAETRYLLNDFAVKHATPWIYGACTGTDGRVMTIRSPQTPCLRCLFPEPPAVGELPTCDTAGVLGPAANAIAALQAVAALKILSGNSDSVGNDLITIDFWNNRYKSIDLIDARRADCRCCVEHRFDFLDVPMGAGTTQLCGRNAVQIRPRRAVTSLENLHQRLQTLGRVERNAHFLRYWPGDLKDVHLTVFADGRTVVHGTSDQTRARSIAAKHVGC
jgi:molybdopterin/thiamine biosynthesis adenylyltransferase